MSELEIFMTAPFPSQKFFFSIDLWRTFFDGFGKLLFCILLINNLCNDPFKQYVKLFFFLLLSLFFFPYFNTYFWMMEVVDFCDSWLNRDGFHIVYWYTIIFVIYFLNMYCAHVLIFFGQWPNKTWIVN